MSKQSLIPFFRVSKVVSDVDGHQLSGAAYTAGKGLFSELIIPTITRTTIEVHFFTINHLQLLDINKINQTSMKNDLNIDT
ncbi:MAG: hypothetical protein IC227_11490 [Enterococcus lacertideformus]|uniref:Uncharacterized protein n=1 Tax=Enterococcus lacertideformus TaxID=2771493 RepID=A0A931FBR5_9ENTE|nr:hypothetical protein [Enterococcus lacertideformus]